MCPTQTHEQRLRSWNVPSTKGHGMVTLVYKCRMLSDEQRDALVEARSVLAHTIMQERLEDCKAVLTRD